MRFPRAADYILDDADAGFFGVHADVFTDPTLYELEMRHIFASRWAFLTLESEVARPNDFITTHIADTPVLVTRDKHGELHAFLNVCRHKGSLICTAAQGNTPVHVCPYHAWSYNSAGRLVAIRDQASGQYVEAFKKLDHDLIPLPQFASYRGFLFGSLSTDALPLEEYLGDMRFFIDVIADGAPDGLEFVPGQIAYTYRGNWKFQLDNGMDSYHLGTVHNTFTDIMAKRKAGDGASAVRHIDWDKRQNNRLGSYGFRHGHTALWIEEGDKEGRPGYLAAEAARSRLGNTKVEWMLRGRNYFFFPNMQIQDSQSLMLRVFRPLSVDRTEMQTYCLAPKGEPSEMRAWRVRQYEEFFNPGGLATPDDATVYEYCHEALRTRGLPVLQGYSRGLAAVHAGGNTLSAEAGLTPLFSFLGTTESYTETAMHEPYREWARLIDAGLATAGGSCP